MWPRTIWAASSLKRPDLYDPTRNGRLSRMVAPDRRYCASPSHYSFRAWDPRDRCRLGHTGPKSGRRRCCQKFVLMSHEHRRPATSSMSFGSRRLAELPHPRLPHLHRRPHRALSATTCSMNISWQCGRPADAMNNGRNSMVYFEYALCNRRLISITISRACGWRLIAIVRIGHGSISIADESYPNG